MGRRFICFLAFSIWTVGASALRAGDCTHDAVMKWVSEHDFRLQTADGSELYCGKVLVLGSRIPYTQCGTEAELKSYLFQIDDDLFSSCKEYWR
jgi:hypothetical protein